LVALNTIDMNTIVKLLRRNLVVVFVAFSSVAFGQSSSVEELQRVLDSLRVAGNYPGLSMSIVFKDNSNITLTSGFNDVGKAIPLKTSDKLLQGSVGKTYAAAIAMQQIGKKALDLEEKVSKYLGHYDWYPRIPNANDITVRMLMNHTSGVMRYEFKESFTKDLTANPDKTWKPEELLSYVLDEKASFEAGKGWEYSDTNYILLGMILEKITGKKFYQLVADHILKPLNLKNTFPSDKRMLPGLAQGYAGEANDFGGKDKVIDESGNFIINPQFEWTGGGIYSTTQDLAQWGKLLYEGKAFDKVLLEKMFEGVPAKLGKDSKYGLGVIMKPTPLGETYGHSGFFPGYLTEMAYFPNQQVCIALQANSSDFKKIRTRLSNALVILMKTSQR
jgi:D-alanyl-D-alanine carboxypeptidase